MNQIMLINAYVHGGQWVFDDTDKGLQKEPFVCGADEMIDRLCSKGGVANTSTQGGQQSPFAVLGPAIPRRIENDVVARGVGRQLVSLRGIRYRGVALPGDVPLLPCRTEGNLRHGQGIGGSLIVPLHGIDFFDFATETPNSVHQFIGFDHPGVNAPA